jgi:hypothetical protein
LQNFYIEHSHLVEQTLSHVSLQLLRYVFNFGAAPDKADHRGYEDVLKVGRRFLENLPSYYGIVLGSLGRAFVEAVRDDKEEEAFEAVKYIDFCYVQLMKHEHGYEEMEYITEVMTTLTEGLALVAQNSPRRLHRLFLRDALLLLYNLLERRRGVAKINRKEQELLTQKYLVENGTEELPPERKVFL